ncbi:MAG: efflux RND transporter periplasmic adaptor subunit [Cellvibrionaceae bacterium]|nr:efflux RND transporter periplasmic adaptor subunit [Cellvibrionaceae bacterium]
MRPLKDHGTKWLAAPVMISSLLLAACQGSSETAPTPQEITPRPVKLHTLSSSDSTNERLFPAQVQANRQTELSFRISGQLEELTVLPGETVKQGQLLARLDSRDLKNELALREANYRFAANEQKRIAALFERKLVSQSALDQSNNNYKTTLSLYNIAKQQLEHSTLRAPFNARIASKEVENFQYIQPQQTILSLQASDTLDIRIEIPEKLLAELGSGGLNYDYQPKVFFKTQPNKAYPLSYKQHNTQADSATQSYELIYSLPAPDNTTLYPGMSATVQLNISTLAGRSANSDGFIIPLSAVLKDDGKGLYQVWRYSETNNTVEAVAVKLGRVSESGILVHGNLSTDEQLVAAGLNKLKPGMKVKPLSYERGI